MVTGCGDKVCVVGDRKPLGIQGSWGKARWGGVGGARQRSPQPVPCLTTMIASRLVSSNFFDSDTQFMPQPRTHKFSPKKILL